MENGDKIKTKFQANEANLNIEQNLQNGSSSSISQLTTVNSEIDSIPPLLQNDIGNTGEDSHLEALHNDLIWDNILQYLTYNEKKKLSLTCKNFQLRIWNNKCFQNSSVIRINSLHPFDPHISNGPEPIWKQVEITMYELFNSIICQNNVRNLMQKRLQFVENFKLFMTTRDLDFINYTPVFLKPLLLSSTPILLKSLTIDYTILCFDLQNSFSHPHIQTCLENLEELHISGRRTNSVTIISYNKEEVVTTNTTILASIPRKLKSFSWGKIGGHWTNYDEHRASFTRIIVENNRLTLNKLRLEVYVCYLHLHELVKIVCPELKELAIFARLNIWQYVNSFLQGQPLLESLDLEFIENCGEELLKTVCQRSQKLKKLRLKARNYKNKGKMLKYLKGMTNLEEVEIQIRIGRYVDHSEAHITSTLVLKALPPTITHLTLGRLHSGGIDYCCDHICDTCPEFDLCTCENRCECIPVPMAQHVIPRLARFVHLTELTILNRKAEIRQFDFDNIDDDESMVNDEVLQFIITRMVKLKILRFGHCPNLTDFGITGIAPVPEVENGLPLHHLSDLRELMIKNCPRLSDNALTSAMIFPRLIKLHLEPNIHHANLISENALVQIVQQNPSLTTVVVHSAEDVTELLKSSNPSLVKVYNIHLKKCDNEFDQARHGYYDDPFSEDEDESETEDDDGIMGFVTSESNDDSAGEGEYEY